MTGQPKSSLWNSIRQMRRMSKRDHVEFWRKDDLRNIIPPGTEHPAGWDEALFLRRFTAMLDPSSVLEIGCGWGRLCKAFDSDTYTGIDINPQAIEKAAVDYPGYQFNVVSYDEDYPETDLCMAYTVLLHIDDQLIENVVERIHQSCKQVLVAEILGRRWRATSKTVPVFNRDRQDYVDLFHGFTLEMETRKPYLRYRDTEISFLHFVKKGS